jgi:hypothetical protein
MADSPGFDIEQAHRYFSVACFNRAWDLINKQDRSPEEDEEMLRLSMASLYHWGQRMDVTERNLSVGYWQLSRIYTILRRADDARDFGQRCLEVSQAEDMPPIYLGYAYEALARAESLAGERAKMKAYFSMAQEAAESVTDLEDHNQLLSDLETIH